MLQKYSVYILVGSLFILGLSVGFFVGRTLNQELPNSGDIDQPRVESQQNNLYSSQSAFIRGEIIKREGNELTVRNLNNKTEGKIRTSNRVVIAKAGTRPASPSSDLSTIELNKEASINLEMINGEYQAVVIQYTFPAPSLPPIPSAKATLSPQPSQSP